MNTLVRSLLFSTVFISSFLSNTNDARAARLIINGSDEVGCDTGDCGLDGVDFQTDNKLYVLDAQNIGQTSGVSVTASGGNNIGDIAFQGISTILGSVTPTGNILRLIELDEGAGQVTANSDVRVSTLYLPGDSWFIMRDGANLTANVESNSGQNPSSRLLLFGSHTITGEIGTSTDWMKVILYGGTGSVVKTTGNIYGNVLFYLSNAELRIAPNKNINGWVGQVSQQSTDNYEGIVTFEGNSVSNSLNVSRDWIGTLERPIKQVNINAGTLLLNHNIYATNTIVNACARLLVSNNVTVAPTLINNGIVQIGTLSGSSATTNTLSVGTYTGNPDSSLNLIVTNGGANYSRLNATTAFTIPTNGLKLLMSGNTIPNSTVLDNIITTPSLSLDSNTPMNTATYRFVPTYSTPNLDITVITTPMSQIVPNNSIISSIAQFFDTVGPSIQTTAPGLVPVYDALNAQPNALALQSALASLTLPVNGNLLAISNGVTSRGFSVITGRMDNLYCSQEPLNCSMKRGTWLEFYYSGLDQGGDDIITGTGYTAQQWGVIGGYDKALYPSLNTGAAVAYSKSNSTSKGMINNTLAADTFQGFLYANHELCNGLYWDGILSLGYNSYNQERFIDLASNINRFPNACGIDSIPFGLAENAKAKFGGWQFNSYIEGGYQYRTCKLVIVPHLIFKTVYIRTEDFSETGAPIAGFKNVQYDDMQEVDLGLGIKIAKNYICCKKYKLTPYVKLAALYDAVNSNPRSVSKFIAGGPELITTGTNLGANSLQSSLGLTLNLKDNSFLTLEYLFEKRTNLTMLEHDFEKRSNFKMYSAFLKYRVEWC